METYIDIPGMVHHCNLAIFPATLVKETHVYLLGTSHNIPVESEFKVKVEYLENHIYCLLPSYQPSLGTVCYYKECPEFIKDFPFWMDLGKVPPPAIQPDIRSKKCEDSKTEKEAAEKVSPSGTQPDIETKKCGEPKSDDDKKSKNFGKNIDDDKKPKKGDKNPDDDENSKKVDLSLKKVDIIDDENSKKVDQNKDDGNKSINFYMGGNEKCRKCFVSHFPLTQDFANSK